MEATKEETLREIEVKANELAFFGKIAAGVTHELKNVLAIIKESNGLMADLLAMLKETPFVYREKFQRSIGRIEEQVRRGTEITSRFNGFAHGVDHPVASIDLNAIVAQTVLLAARFARLQHVELRRGSLRSSCHACYQPVPGPDGFDKGDRGLHGMYERRWLYIVAGQGSISILRVWIFISMANSVKRL